MNLKWAIYDSRLGVKRDSICIRNVRFWRSTFGVLSSRPRACLPPKPWNQTDAAAFADSSRYGNVGSAILNDVNDDDF
jgi:hypothetical protein